MLMGLLAMGRCQARKCRHPRGRVRPMVGPGAIGQPESPCRGERPTTQAVGSSACRPLFLRTRDLGAAYKSDNHVPAQETQDRYVGTPYYMPPEVCTGALGTGNTPVGNIWALGIIALELVCLRVPYEGQRCVAWQERGWKTAARLATVEGCPRRQTLTGWYVCVRGAPLSLLQMVFQCVQKETEWFTRKMSPVYSEDLKRIIHQMLTKASAARPTAGWVP
jgi:serine/threonine protein kinase